MRLIQGKKRGGERHTRSNVVTEPLSQAALGLPEFLGREDHQLLHILVVLWVKFNIPCPERA